MSKKHIRYTEGLENIYDKDINTLEYPWQRNFIENFYKQLGKQKLQKKELIDKIDRNATLRELLDKNYELKTSSLSQYTNIDSKNIRPINVNTLIAIASSLNVSIDYLLGIEECENHENTDINQVTGLNNEAINTLKSNKNLKKQLNFFLNSSKINYLAQVIEEEHFLYSLEQGVLMEYGEDLRNDIINIYEKYYINTFSLERNENHYANYLSNELSLSYIKSKLTDSENFFDYMKENLINFVYEHIMDVAKSKNMSSEGEIHSLFIDDLATKTFSIMEHKYNCASIKIKISEIFSAILDEYFQTPFY